MFKSLLGSKDVIGLDIGNSLIKAAELDVSRKGAVLQSFGWVPTPAGSIHLGEVTNPEALAAAIAEVIGQLKTKRKHVVTSIWGTSVFVKKINGIPIVDRRILNDQIRFEVEQINPYGNMDLVNFDYHVLSHAPSGSEGQSVLVVIAQKDLLFKYAEVIAIAGYTCSAIDVTGFALANTFEFNYGIQPTEVCAILNVGSEVTNFVIIHGGDVILSKDLPAGGFNYTNEIARAMGVSLPEAEDLKLAVSTGQQAPAEVLEIINSTHEVVVDSFKGAFDFFTQTVADLAVKRIYFTGGSMGVPGLAQRVSEATGIPFEVMNPFLKIRPGKNISDQLFSQVAPYASVAVGLALRKVGG